MTSIHAGNITDVYEMPITEIIRPFMSEVSENKVRSIMKTLSNPATAEEVPPIDVMWVVGSEGGNYYYSFGGCHRYIAHIRLKLPTIRVKLVRSTVKDLWIHLGSSTPDLK
ncbi:putative sulfiredoxin isoform X2 [Aethina tumida]|uniref:putative sulfiredoxin isoform X2 n=1 Tax=Aethina tumida TaxID=116153 RepID=UPI00096B36F9|nr:putative sulfiredoxin isoform X2 [Aethina tumida]XP_049821227.1 putative sulfiredoxin isoform X2 [Aethina tumida]